MDITIYDQSCPPQAWLLWDTVWDSASGAGDWAIAAPAEAGNRKGLAAHDPIRTSVINALFTDARCPPDHPLAPQSGADRRGWWGDAVDRQADAAAMGSLLWLLENATASEANAAWAKLFCEDALAPLIAAGLVASVIVDAAAYPARSAIAIAVDVIGRDGRRAPSLTFDLLWKAQR